MEAFPFTEAEWDPLKELAQSILNAHFADDDVLGDSLRLDMLDRVDALRARHGDHPVLLETAADYADDPAERAALYRRAVDHADGHELPTLSIRLSFAPVLVELGEPVTALDELRACGSEATAGSADEREQWLRALADVCYVATGDANLSPLYRRAAEIAESHGLSAFRIRLLHARFLLDVGDPEAAREELWRFRSEAPIGADEDRAWWADLLAEAGRVKRSAGLTPRAGDSGSR